MSNATERELLRRERDLLRELVATRSTLDELTVLVAKQNDRLDEVVTMLRRREAQLGIANCEFGFLMRSQAHRQGGQLRRARRLVGHGRLLA